MANRQRAEARRKAAAKAAGGGGSKLWIWLSLGLAAALIVVLVVVVAGGDDETASGGSSGSTPTETDGGSSNIPDSQPVEVTGESLPTYDSAAPLDQAVGMTAPVVVGKNFQGDEITIDAATNGPTMVVFLAHWCPHCNAEVPRLLDWKTLGGDEGINVIGVATAVSSNSVNYPPHEWFSSRGWSWPVLVDEKQGDGAAGTVAQAFGASAWPYFVIIGADGEVKVRVSGEVEVDRLEEIVAAALAA